MKVALITGIYVEADAISNLVTMERRVLQSAGHEVCVFCQGTSFTDDASVVVGSNPWGLAEHPHYRFADLAVFHFGTAYELFDALLLDAPTVRRVVRFHNVTPPELLSGQHRVRAQRGLDQLVIAENADQVWCDSNHNRDVLANLGIPAEKSSVHPLAVPEVDRLRQQDRAQSGSSGIRDVSRILFVGRLLPAKGVLNLCAAFEASDLWRDGVELVLAGNQSLSDSATVASVADRAATTCDGMIRVVLSPTDKELANLYQSASIFAMPSLHEGFCVPVLEALAYGLRVVSTDAGALPDTVGDHGTVVPADDIDPLAAALIEAVDADRVTGRPLPPWDYLDSFSEDSFRGSLLRLVSDWPASAESETASE